MKLCNQCGYCNGDYMDACARCNASLSPLPGTQDRPSYHAGGYAAPTDAANIPGPNAYNGYPASPPQITRPQPQAYPMTAQNSFGGPSAMPGYPGEMTQPGMPPSYAQPGYGVQNQPQPPYPGMQGQMPPPGMPPAPPYPPAPQISRPQYGNSPYPYASQQARPYEAQRQLPPLGGELFEPSTEQSDSTADPFPVKPTKRSPVGKVLLVLLLLLVLSGGLLYFFHANGMFPMEVSQEIDGVINSVTGIFGGGSPEEREQQAAYDTMVSRVCNTTGASEEQAKAIVNTLLYQCGATDLYGINGHTEADTYKVNTPEGTCLIRLDATKVLLEVMTVETNPRYIYQNGNVLDSIGNLCLSEDALRQLKTHAQERMQSYLPAESVSDYAFAVDEEWEYHKEQNWVAVYSYVAPNTEGGFNERIPFYFEYEYTVTDNQPSYTLKYAMIQGQSKGERHFTDLVNPFDNGASSAPDASAGEPSSDTTESGTEADTSSNQ